MATTNGRGLAVGVVVALGVLLLWQANFFAATRLRMQDAYLLPEPVTKSVVIVAIDDASLAHYGRTVAEWPRSVFADLIQRLNADGARVIALDILFAESTPDDDVLVDAITQARTSQTRTRFVMPIVSTDYPTRDTSYTIELGGGLRPLTALTQAVDYLGFVGVYPDIDGTVRRQTSQVQIGDSMYYNFSLATYLAYLRLPAAAAPQMVTMQPEGLRISPTITLPIDAQGFWWQNFFSYPKRPAADSFDIISVDDVLAGKIPPEQFRDKIALIGLRDITGAADQYRTPLSYQMNGVEIHANAIETLLQNKPLVAQSRTSQIIWIIFLAVGSSLIYSRQRWYWMLPTGVVLVVGVWLGAFLYFNSQREMLNLFHASVALSLPVIAHLGLQISAEYNQRRKAEFLLESVVTVSRQQLALDAILSSILADVERILKTRRVFVGVWDAQKQDFDSLYRCGELIIPDNPALQSTIIQAIEGQKFVQVSGYLVYPIVWQNRVLAAVLAQSQLDQNTDPIKLLETLAKQIAPSLENALLHTKVSALSDLKTQMIRMASHDLKNPISAVRGYAELILKISTPETLADRNRHYIDNILQASQHALELLDDILSLEQIRDGQMQKQPLQLDALVTEISKRHHLDLKRKNQTILIDVQTGLAPIMGDRRQLFQAITNLVVNAIKYTPDGGQISLRLYKQNEYVRLEIQDNGYGIPEDAQDKLFEAFYRVESKATEHIEGTGLGLSLVKSVIDSHQGRIWVKSEEGVGSTFFVELPFAESV